MIKYFLSIIAIFALTNSFAQEQKTQQLNTPILVTYPSSDKELKYTGGRFQTVFRKKLEEKYVSNFATRIKITPIVELQSSKMIEGMETMYVTEIVFKLKMINRITKENETWKHIVKSKASSIRNAGSKAVNKMKTNGGYDKALAFVDSYMQKTFGDDCQTYIKLANESYDAGNYIQAIQISNYIPKTAACYDNAKTLMDDAFLQEQKKRCNDYIYKANLAYESGNYEYSLKNIYKISPRSLCAKEAMDLAKKIGKKIKKSKDTSTKTLNIHKFIIEHNETSTHQEWDKKLLSDMIFKR